MAFNLSAVIVAARDQHPAFHRSRAPDAVVARWLSDYVNALMQKALSRDSSYMRQSLSVMLALESANEVGVAGAGTSGGLPGTVSASGDSFSATQSPAGSLVTVGVTAADGATVQVAERVVTSATATTVSSTGAGRTVNEDIGRLVVVTGGLGAGQYREVVSNTAAQWTIDSNTPWATVPDTTSLIEVVAPVYLADETAGVVTALPAETQMAGYLVKVGPTGVPYLDFDAPVVAQISAGVPLPPMHAILGATVRYTDASTPSPLLLVTPDRRFDAVPPAAFVAGEKLYLCGDAAEWDGVESVEIAYAPVAPALTRLTDTVLLPDAAKPCVVQQAAAYLAQRVAGLPDVTIDPGVFALRGADAERSYLSSLGLSKRSATLRIRDENPYA